MGAGRNHVVRWLDFGRELLAHPVVPFPRHAISAELAATFGTQVSWNWMDADGDVGFDLHYPIGEMPWPTEAAELAPLLLRHPLVRWFQASGDPKPMSIDHLGAQFRSGSSRRVVAEYLEPIGMEQQLSIPYQLDGGHHRAFVLARGRDGFTDHELHLAAQVQTVLLLVDRQQAVLMGTRGEGGSLLTPREQAVLVLLGGGLTSAAIGRRLGISQRTVHRHLQHVYRKLDVADRLSAVLRAQEQGLLDHAPAPPEDVTAATFRTHLQPAAALAVRSGGHKTTKRSRQRLA